MQGGWSSAENGFDVAHEIEHLEGKSHHHDDDGTVHYDESGKSIQHHAEHSASCQGVALLPSFSPYIALKTYPVINGELRQHLPDHVSKQPQRPPQALG